MQANIQHIHIFRQENINSIQDRLTLSRIGGRQKTPFTSFFTVASLKKELAIKKLRFVVLTNLPHC